MVVNANDAWPGALTILPCLGTALVIYAELNDSSVLRFKLIQFMGLISYSVYLVHWPLIVITREYNIAAPFIVYCAIVLILSWLLYQKIELNRVVGKNTILLYITTLIGSILLGISGWKHRVPQQYSLTRKEYHQKFYGGAGFPSRGAAQNEKRAKSSDILNVLYGDSFARQYAAHFKKWNMIYLFMDGCFCSERYMWNFDKRYDNRCKDRYKNLIRILSENNDRPVNIIYAQRWLNWSLTERSTGKLVQDNNYKILLSEIHDIAGKVAKINSNAKILLVGAYQNSEQDLYKCLARRELLPNKLLGLECDQFQPKKLLEINKLLSNLSKIEENIVFINPNDILCDDSKCRLLINGNPIYSDGSHLSRWGAEYVGKGIGKILKQLN